MSSIDRQPSSIAHKEPGMNTRVCEHMNGLRVHKSDYCLDMCGIVTGVALIALSVALFTLSYNVFGWTSGLTSSYMLYGAIGATGGLITVLSIKGAVRSYKQSLTSDPLRLTSNRV